METTKTLYAVDFAVEEFNAGDGVPEPTGRFFEVSEVAIVDYGGNEYAHCKTARGMARRQKRFLIPTRIKAVKRVGPARKDLYPTVICDY